MAKKDNKKNKGGGKAAIIAAILLLLGGGGYGYKVGFGSGSADGNGAVNIPFINTQETTQDSTKGENVVTIKVADSVITVNGETVEAAALKDKISALQAKDSTTKYVVEDDYAIKATMDEVKAVMSELSTSLGITVDYK